MVGLLLLAGVAVTPLVSVTVSAAGLLDVYGASFAAYARYLPQLNFTAVLPVPKTSYAAPTRGVMSL